MILPVGNTAKRERFPIFTLLLIVANFVVFYLTLVRPETDVEWVVATYALVPSRWEPKTLFTSMFLHAGILHLLGNMLLLWVMGDNVEGRLGHLPHLVLYFISGACGAAAHIVFAASVGGDYADTPTVGASGAISGVIGAYLIFFPGSKIRFTLIVTHFMLHSWIAIGLWVGLQVLTAWAHMEGDTTPVAVFAHLGGFAFGFLAALVVRLFGLFKPRREERA